MSRKGLRCPNCDSLQLTFIVYWKLLRDLKNRTIDLFVCRTCGKRFHMRTREELPKSWKPSIEWPKLSRREADKIGQLDLEGQIQYIERTIWPLPHLNIEPTGEMVCVYSIPLEHQNKQYQDMCDKMCQELLEYRPTWKIPDWYKYKVKKGLE